jgi:FlaA1/EpsC-like NDP-sugar epimerase
MHMVRNRYLFVSDLVMIMCAAYGSFVLRLDRLDLRQQWPGFVVFVGLALVVMPLIFYRCSIYARYWAYASLEELLLLVNAVVASVLIITGTSLIVSLALLEARVPRSIPLLFFMLVLGGIGLPRLLMRLVVASRQQKTGEAETRPVLVMGAGSAGAMMVRELRANPHLGMKVVGFLDDDPHKRALRIYGVPVLGTRHDLRTVAQQHGVTRVIIAMPTASGKVIRDVVALCEQANAEAKIIPSMHKLIDGTVRVNQLRDVEIEDLLRRTPVQTDGAAVTALLRGKRVLVTGGGGSIGSELCRQVLRCGPSELVVVGHGENSVFAIENELRTMVQTTGTIGTRISAVIADIRFRDRMQTIFEHYRPEVVFHAAAHKHVPLMELNPVEAITNNVLGTRNLVDTALVTGVERFVMISTDKAVNPTNVMGASKRAAELVVHHAATISGKAFVAVRFGNVLGSRGSVVLTFKQQIAAGGPVTVTHPKMRRYFMTIPEAVQLVLQAAVLGTGGEVFVLDMGKPVKIVDLAHDMIELSGLEVGRDIDIAFTGLRPGEKLFEELFIAGEEYERTAHEKIYIAANASSFVPSSLDHTLDDLAHAAHWNDHGAIRNGLKQLVREYMPKDEPPPDVAPAGANAVRGTPYPLRPRDPLSLALRQIPPFHDPD